jgi:hypothetical protein
VTDSKPRPIATYQAPEVAIDLVNQLVDFAIVRHTNTDGETFQECLIFGQWEEHTDDCPFPALDRWLKS